MKIQNIILIVFLPILSTAQQNDSLTDDKLTNEEFGLVIKNNFTSVANNNSKTTIGNFASVDLNEGSLAFNASMNFTNGNFLSLKAGGAINDNIFSVFTESHLSPNVSAEAKYSLIFRRVGKLGYAVGDAAQMHQQISNNAKKLEFENNMKIYYKKRDSLRLVKQIKSLEEIIADLEKAPKLDAAMIDAKKNQLDSLNLAFLKIKMLPDADQLGKQAVKENKKSTKEILNAFEVTTIGYGWFSFAAGFQNNTFTQFDSQFDLPANQLKKMNYTSFHASLEYNYYHWNHYSSPTFYFLIGASGFLNDNFEDMTKLELTDVTQYGDSFIQRSLTKKRAVYKGDYQQNLMGAKVYADYYQFFFKNSVAIHVFPEGIYGEHSIPQYNAGVGMLFSFTDAKDKEEKSKLNIELYYKIMDVSNVEASSVTTLKRNQIGLRLSVPVKFFSL